MKSMNVLNESLCDFCLNWAVAASGSFIIYKYSLIFIFSQSQTAYCHQL